MIDSKCQLIAALPWAVFQGVYTRVSIVRYTPPGSLVCLCVLNKYIRYIYANSMREIASSVFVEKGERYWVLNVFEN